FGFNVLVTVEISQSSLAAAHYASHLVDFVGSRIESTRFRRSVPIVALLSSWLCAVDIAPDSHYRFGPGIGGDSFLTKEGHIKLLQYTYVFIGRRYLIDRTNSKCISIPEICFERLLYDLLSRRMGNP